MSAISLTDQTILGILCTAAAGLILAIWFLVAQGKYRARIRCDVEELRRLFELERKVCADTFFERKENPAHAREEEHAGNAEAGRALTRSSRAEALRLLRSGLSPETAASSLGIGKREMRLLERVARTFSVG